ncbi:MAG: toxic anion resistance protein [Erysipelotrichaceae bacterium]|nr:toxic anion resistance protein [Erysipelotrichaceae bacterium]
MSEQQEIKLTLDPQENDDASPVTNEQAEEKQPVDQIDEAEKNLSEEEKKTVDDFAEKIDITQSNTILQYGSAAQKKVSDFSDSALKNVRTKDLGEVGDLLTNLVTELKNFDTDTTEKKGFFSNLFDRSSNSISKFQAKYSKAESNVDKVSDMLEKQQIVLLKDIALLDQLYERNQQNTKELTMYILAGRKKLQEVRSTQLPALTARAKESGLPEDAQAANDLEQACVRFEKKLYDLELTRQVSIQMAPQIRMVQNNDTVMTEKIQSTLVNTIPLWKNQIVLSLGIQHSREAMEAQREVSNMTNELLKKNAETLHQATVDTAKESERGIVDIETLQHTNKELISTLDEILTIQKEGREKRQAAEQELNKIENELSDKLLEINSDRKESQ